MKPTTVSEFMPAHSENPSRKNLPMTDSAITLRFQSQSEQVHGYWLIEYQLATPFELPFNYAFKVAGQRLQLFSQTEQKALFLAIKPLETLQNQLQTFQNDQAWLFWSQFSQNLDLKRPILLLASDLQLASLFFVAKQLQNHSVIALLHASDQFPFIVKPTQILFEHFPAEAIGCCPLLEDWKIPNRLCSDQGLAGCFEGNFEQLFKEWQVPQNWQTLTLTPVEAIK